MVKPIPIRSDLNLQKEITRTKKEFKLDIDKWGKQRSEGVPRLKRALEGRRL